MYPKMFFFLKFGTCTRNGSFGAFWIEHSPNHLEVNSNGTSFNKNCIIKTIPNRA